MSIEAMKLALDALDALYINDYSGYEISKHDAHIVDDAITALRQALEQPEQEPVAYLYKYRDGWTSQLRFDGSKPMEVKKLYTAPPKREWVGLTDEEVGALTVFDGLHHVETPVLAEFARVIEAKLKEKNHD